MKEKRVSEQYFLDTFFKSKHKKIDTNEKVYKYTGPALSFNSAGRM
jgi:hypothetical protein